MNGNTVNEKEIVVSQQAGFMAPVVTVQVIAVPVETLWVIARVGIPMDVVPVKAVPVVAILVEAINVETRSVETILIHLTHPALSFSEVLC